MAASGGAPKACDVRLVRRRTFKNRRSARDLWLRALRRVGEQFGAHTARGVARTSEKSGLESVAVRVPAVVRGRRGGMLQSSRLKRQDVVVAFVEIVVRAAGPGSRRASPHGAVAEDCDPEVYDHCAAAFRAD